MKHLYYILFPLLAVFFLSLTSPVFAFSGSGSGSSSDPYQITTCSQLQEMANNLSASYKQMSDIDCSGSTWVAVGNSSSPFTGIFDGQNYSISHLTIGTVNDNNGFFNETSGATIKNVRLVSGSLTDTGGFKIGSLVAIATNTTILHSSSQLALSGDTGVGGLVGDSENSLTLQRSFYNGTMTGNSYVGGLVAYLNGSSNTISDCYTNGIINAPGGFAAGGLVGVSLVTATSTISNCYSNMTISVDGGTDIGGLVGDGDLNMSNSFSAASLSGTGFQMNEAFGLNDGVATNVYFDKFLAGSSTCNSGTASCIPVNSGNSNPNYFKSNHMNAPLSLWDFTNTWQINSGDYPTLLGFTSPSTWIADPSSWSAPSTTETPVCGDAAPASAPDLFQLRANGDSATLYFAPDSGTNSGYYIGYGFDGNAQMFGTTFSYSSSNGVIAYTVNDLFPGTWYFKIRGQNGCMPGPWSNVMKVTVTQFGTAVSNSTDK